jgi:hypothetical protein
LLRLVTEYVVEVVDYLEANFEASASSRLKRLTGAERRAERLGRFRKRRGFALERAFRPSASTPGVCG